MPRRRRALVLALLALPLACGDSGGKAGAGAVDAPVMGADAPYVQPAPAVDAGPESMARPADAAAAEDAPGADAATAEDAPAAVDAAIDGPVDAAAPDQAPADARPQMVPPTAHLLGDWQLVGDMGSTCSTGTGPDGHRWCALARAGMPGRLELWVVDTARFTKSPLLCSVGAAGCLRLTERLHVRNTVAGEDHPYIHRFFGDTLIFYGDSNGAHPWFHGKVQAWRPGWTAPRALTSDQGTACFTDARGQLVWCREEDDNYTLDAGQWDLRAGRIGAELPPVVTHIHPYVDANRSARASNAFSADGTYFAFSGAGPDPGDGELLWVSKIDDLGHPERYRVAVRNVDSWRLGPDSQTVFYLRGRGLGTTGTLVSADLAAGSSGERTLAAGVSWYWPLADLAGNPRGVVYEGEMRNAGSTLTLLRDPSQPPGAPGNLVTLASDVSAPMFSPDGRYVSYTRPKGDGGSEYDTLVLRTDGSGGCTIGALPFVPSSRPASPHRWIYERFTADGALLTHDAWLVDPATCAGHAKLADRVESTLVDGAAGILFTVWDGQEVSTYYERLANGALAPEGPILLTPHSPGDVAFSHDGVLFRVEGGHGDRGLYFTALPTGR